MDRVCDSCFNRLIAEAEARNIAVAKAQKILDSLPPEKDSSAISPTTKEGTDSFRSSFSSGDQAESPLVGTDDTSSHGMRKVLSNGSLSSGGHTPVSTLEKSTSSDQLNKQAAASVGSRATGATTAANEVAEVLLERGLKLEAVSEKAEALSEVTYFCSVTN